MAEYSSYINKQSSWIYSHSSKFLTFQAAVFSATLVKKITWKWVAHFTVIVVSFWPFQWLYFQPQKICSIKNHVNVYWQKTDYGEPQG